MGTEHTVYFICAVAGCSLVGIQVILQVFGFLGHVDVDHGHVDADAHVDVDCDHDLGTEGHGNLFFGILSLKALTAFVGIFGLVGMIVEEANLSFPSRIGIAIGAGVVGMFAIARLMLMLVRLQASGTIDYRNAIGQQGSVYLRIPKAGEGRGKVTVTVQGRSKEFAAVSDGPEITTGKAVKVVSVEGSTLRVTPA